MLLSRFGIRVRRFLVFRGVGIAKLRFERVGAPWRSQIAQVELFHTCTTFLRVLRAPKALFALLGARGVERSPVGRRGGPRGPDR